MNSPTTNYGPVQGANLLDWPIDLAEMEPWCDLAEKKRGVTRTNGWPGLRGNDNKVLQKGAKVLGYKEAHTGRMAIKPVDNDGRSARQHTGVLLSGLQMGDEMVFPLYRRPARGGDRRLEVRENGMAPRVECDANGKVRRRLRGGRPDRRSGPSAQLRRFDVPGRARRFPGSGRTQPHAAHDRLGLRGLRQAGADVARRDHGRQHAGRGRHGPSRGLVGGRELETLALGLPFMAAFLDPGAWGRAFTTALDGYENMAGLWIVGEDMRQETNRVTLNHEAKDARGMPVANGQFHRPPEGCRDAGPRLQAGCRDP